MNRTGGTTKRPSGTTGKDSRTESAGVPRAALSRRDQRDREPIMTLGADGLNRRREDAGLVGQRLVGLALGFGGGIRVLGVGQRAVPDDVVGDDQGTGPRVLERPGEVVRGID